jgi:UDP-glucose 4-epimerase
MKILVTGGAGFIGTNLVKRLLKEGHIVNVIDDFTTGSFDNKQNCDYYHGDITNLECIDNDAFSGIDLIFHLAAASRVQPSFKNPSKTFEINVAGTKNICEWARINKIKMVYAGSSSKHHDPYKSPYAATKYMGEEVCKMYKETYGCDIEIARFYNVYGPYEPLDEENGNVIGIWRSRIARGANIEIVGDGKQRRDFTHVDDIVDGLWRIGMVNEKHRDAWELGTGVNYSVNELAKMFSDKFRCSRHYIKEQLGNYRATLCESEDAMNILGWKPQDRLLYYINNLD